MKTLRWGIIGLGRFGAIHASTVSSLPGCVVSAVCNRNQEKLDHAARQFPDAFSTVNYREVLERDDIDVVSITTHWQQHFELAKAALIAGKHVMLEKPMAETAEQCRELVSLARECSGYLMIGHVCRFDARAALAREAIADGRIGRIISMHAKRNLPVAPGNVRLNKISPLMGDGVHDADLMMWFMQCMPSRVYAKNTRVHEFTYPDSGWAMLEFGQEAVGVIETNWCLPPGVATVIDARIEVVGSEGMLTVDCSQTGFQMTNSQGSRMCDTVYLPELHGRRVGAFSHQLEYFSACIREGTPPTVVTAEDGWKAVAVMEAAEHSAAIGQPVEITQGELT